jgi:thiol-disulfide isomerase/thioredoxin
MGNQPSRGIELDAVGASELAYNYRIPEYGCSVVIIPHHRNSMRIFPHAVFVLFLASLGCSAQEKKDTPELPKKPKKLAVGDPAPPLKVHKWLTGKETTFEKGKVYIVEFWATWCGPCIVSMPHLNQLLEEYQSNGLTVIATTNTDEQGNTLQAVEKFIAGPGKKYGFTYAFCNDDATYDAYMTASGREGIPASFVVDREGKIAFMGHPAELDDVIPRLLDGKWQGRDSLEEIKTEKESLDNILRKVPTAADAAEKANAGKDEATISKAVQEAAAAAAAKILEELPSYEKLYPYRAKQSLYQAAKLAVMLQARKYDDAVKQSESLLTLASKKKDAQLLGHIRSFWTNKALNPDRKTIQIAVRAAEAAYELDQPNLSSLLGLAEAHYAAGNAVKGKEFGDKAIKLSENAQQREAVEKVLKSYQQ